MHLFCALSLPDKIDFNYRCILDLTWSIESQMYTVSIFSHKTRPGRDSTAVKFLYSFFDLSPHLFHVYVDSGRFMMKKVKLAIYYITYPSIITGTLMRRYSFIILDISILLFFFFFFFFFWRHRSVLSPGYSFITLLVSYLNVLWHLYDKAHVTLAPCNILHSPKYWLHPQTIIGTLSLRQTNWCQLTLKCISGVFLRLLLKRVKIFHTFSLLRNITKIVLAIISKRNILFNIVFQ